MGDGTVATEGEGLSLEQIENGKSETSERKRISLGNREGLSSRFSVVGQEHRLPGQVERPALSPYKSVGLLWASIMFSVLKVIPGEESKILKEE